MAEIRTVHTDLNSWLECTGCGLRHGPAASVLVDSRYRGVADCYGPAYQHLQGEPGTYDDAGDPEHQKIRAFMATHAACPDRYGVETVTERGVKVIDRRRR